MCRFTHGQCSLDCLSINISNYESYGFNLKKPQRNQQLRILPTINELQEDEKYTNGILENTPHPEAETPHQTASSYCLLSSVTHFEKLVKEKTTEFHTKEERWVYTKAKTTVKMTDTMTKRPANNLSNFQGFGDFFPQDFLSDFKENETAGNGVKRYLEKQRVELSKLNCREQELKILHKNQGPEVQSWLHFFG